jgi:hypothetical protein
MKTIPARAVQAASPGRPLRRAKPTKRVTNTTAVVVLPLFATLVRRIVYHCPPLDLLRQRECAIAATMISTES